MTVRRAVVGVAGGSLVAVAVAQALGVAAAGIPNSAVAQALGEANERPLSRTVVVPTSAGGVTVKQYNTNTAEGALNLVDSFGVKLPGIGAMSGLGSLGGSAGRSRLSKLASNSRKTLRSRQLTSAVALAGDHANTRVTAAGGSGLGGSGAHTCEALRLAWTKAGLRMSADQDLPPALTGLGEGSQSVLNSVSGGMNGEFFGCHQKCFTETCDEMAGGANDVVLCAGCAHTAKCSSCHPKFAQVLQTLSTSLVATNTLAGQMRDDSTFQFNVRACFGGCERVSGGFYPAAHSSSCAKVQTAPFVTTSSTGAENKYSQIDARSLCHPDCRTKKCKDVSPSVIGRCAFCPASTSGTMYNTANSCSSCSPDFFAQAGAKYGSVEWDTSRLTFSESAGGNGKIQGQGELTMSRYVSFKACLGGCAATEYQLSYEGTDSVTGQPQQVAIRTCDPYVAHDLRPTASCAEAQCKESLCYWAGSSMGNGGGQHPCGGCNPSDHSDYVCRPCAAGEANEVAEEEERNRNRSQQEPETETVVVTQTKTVEKEANGNGAQTPFWLLGLLFCCALSGWGLVALYFAGNIHKGDHHGTHGGHNEDEHGIKAPSLDLRRTMKATRLEDNGQWHPQHAMANGSQSMERESTPTSSEADTDDVYGANDPYAQANLQLQQNYRGPNQKDMANGANGQSSKGNGAPPQMQQGQKQQGQQQQGPQGQSAIDRQRQQQEQVRQNRERQLRAQGYNH